jgi:hypothetical protein
MKRLSSVFLAVASLLFFISQVAMADTVTVRLGNPQLTPSGIPGSPGGTFANGTFTSTGTVPTSTDAAFGSNHTCGSDSNTGSNCNATWTFNFGAGTFTSATITLGVFGLDSADPGNQVSLFKLTNGAGLDLTALFNAQSEGTNISTRQNCTVNGHAVNGCPEYNIYTITITDAGALAALDGGTGTFQFTMAGTGLDAFGHATTFNGALLDFSELDLNSDTTTPTPEPASLVLLFSGAAGVLGASRRYRRS